MVPISRTLSLMVFVAFVSALAPVPTFAQGRGRHVAGSPRSGAAHAHRRFTAPQKSVFPQPVDPWKSWGTPHVHGRHHLSAPFFSTPGFVGTSSVVVTPPTMPDVVQTTIIYAPSGSPAAAPAFGDLPTLPTPTLVEYPSGWYQLRGDGVTTPYSWVWVPKPPVPPVAVAEPEPAAPPRSAGAHTRDERAPAYRWTNGGVTTWTNRLERVPKQFREQAASTARPD